MDHIYVRMTLIASVVSALLVVLSGTANAVKKNGFDLDNATIPIAEIRRGGPLRDAIFALTNPEFVILDQSEGISGDERVLGVTISGISRAYPIRYLTVHEIVNDVIGSQHYAVSYCPLCGSGIAFATNLDLSSGPLALNFGVSGLLYNSDLLMYDRNTESLWSQISGHAVSGKLVGIELPRIPVRHTTLSKWREVHPDTQIMKPDGRFKASYRRNPYPGYEKSRQLYFPVNVDVPKQFHPKEMVLGLKIDGIYKAYPYSELEKLGETTISDRLGGKRVTIEWDTQAWSAVARGAEGRLLPATSMYWFAWFAFHPKTDVFTVE